MSSYDRPQINLERCKEEVGVKTELPHIPPKVPFIVGKMRLIKWGSASAHQAFGPVRNLILLLLGYCLGSTNRQLDQVFFNYHTGLVVNGRQENLYTIIVFHRSIKDAVKTFQ